VRVLNGGLAAWVAAGGEVAQGAASPAESARTALLTTASTVTAPYPTQAPAWATLNTHQVRERLATIQLVDARAPERYRGEVEPLDRVAGHIPGALNRFFKDNLLPNGHFKPAAQLRSEWLALLAGHAPQGVVHQCGSGVTACHNLLALEAAGLPAGPLYPGSWSAWSAQADCPVELGAGIGMGALR
jgi:thiosulfate/3-mercaptopyruvate sulfurtransferase